MNEFVVVVVGVVVIAVAAYVLVRRTRPRRAPSPSLPATARTPGQAEVTLPVEDADPETPATQRLVADAADRVLAADPEVVTVVVLSRGGRELGRIERRPAASRPFVDVPLALREPHAPRHRGPGQPVEHEHGVGTSAHVRFEEERSEPHRTLADHFELPDAVRERIGNPEDPVQLVCAILEQAGVPIDVDDNFIHAGDQALVVLRTPLRAAVGPDDLSAAFLRYQRSGAKRGVVLTVGTLYTHEMRRREALAPALLHTGPDGIQRMADAVAMGANPLDFVVQTS